MDVERRGNSKGSAVRRLNIHPENGKPQHSISAQNKHSPSIWIFHYYTVYQFYHITEII